MMALPPTRKRTQYQNTRIIPVDWIGKIPSHWELKPLKAVCAFVNGCAFKPAEWTEDGIPIIRIENLNGGCDFNHFCGPVREKYHVRTGCLLFGWSGNRGTSFGPFTWRRAGLFYLNQHIFRVTDFTCDQCWLYWVLKGVTHRIETEAHGIIGMVHITQTKLGRVPVPVPPLDEQQAIAAFLDRETARIDELIAKKVRLIELLQEKRQALISRAVTKGMNPDAAMKPSGVNWLGDVPSKWQIVALKRICSVLKDGTHLPPARVTEGYPLLSVRNIVDGRFKNLLDDSLISAEDFLLLRRSLCVQTNDVLLAIVGATLGKVAIVEDMPPFAIQRSLAVMRPRSSKMTFEFLSFFLQSTAFQGLLWGSVSYSAQPGIYLAALGSFGIASPPIEEQRQIVTLLKKGLTPIDDLLANMGEGIEKLREYRSALITAAVTGQIDVRNHSEDAHAR